MINVRFLSLVSMLLCSLIIGAQTTTTDRIHYTGTELSNPNHHDGQLSPVVGVHNIQTMRANREYPAVENGNGWTYNHQPMMAYWKGRFYMHYLADPVDEHVPPSQTFLQTSADGYIWTSPQILFPNLRVPDGFKKPNRDEQAKDLDAIMHQRVGFYVSKEGRLLAIGNYGVAFDRKDDPNDGNGIGRVVREIKEDGSFGDIYFIYYNHTFTDKMKKASDWKYFEKSRDKGFVRACREILANPRYMMQWVEEADRNDPLIPLNKGYKAYCDYTLPDGRIASLWKHALTSISDDGGFTWAQPVERARGFVNSNAKIWGQRLSDGTYATVYNPSEFRWPLAISLSKDGLEYTTLNLVHGEITPMRYGGNYKSFGPQYVRGIQEGNGTPPDGDLWLTYSVNKEDMWVSRVPVPVQQHAVRHADDDFAQAKSLADLTQWNLYSPLWAPVSLDGKWLVLKDKDPFDYARVERKIPATKELKVSFDLMAEQNNRGLLQIEFLDENGVACSRIELTDEGQMRTKGGARFGGNINYEAGKNYHVEVILSVANRLVQVFIDGKKCGQRMFFAPVPAIERIMFRTGGTRSYPTVDTPADWYGTLPNAGGQDELCSYRIANFKTSPVDNTPKGAILNFEDYRHYVDLFNKMEDENIAQAIPNASSAEWMNENIPLFDCPQHNFEEMFYYRWWTLRKHIKNTPVGYGMTEFLVQRSYADKYNLIACALGHHIYESRWLHNPMYLDQIIHTWYRGNEGGPMKKMMNFSSWNPDAIWARYLVDADKEFLLDMLMDLDAEYKRWESTHRLPNGLYWQGDVQDGMEESISGGRRKKYARPTINSYMYGNAMALSKMALMAGKEEMAKTYEMKADSLKQLVQNKLWNSEHAFFETLRGEESAQVREAIGYIPWYFNLPDADKRYEVAWREVMDSKGFAAPYGLTTAERRHPEFRTRGVGKCEWDGAIWPFASAQTLTAMANYMNNYEQTTLTDSVYFDQMERYVESQSHRGRPYIGEYLDEVTGYWLKGDQERARYYNHSTFNDLMITGLLGLRPRADKTIEVNPLLPDGEWDWFCLDRVPYHGRMLTIVWDKNGDRYRIGKGLSVLLDGKIIGNSETLGRIVCENVL